MMTCVGMLEYPNYRESANEDIRHKTTNESKCRERTDQIFS